MTNPRLEIHLDRIHHNARTLTERLARRGIRVTGVTKATLGSPEIAHELLRAGADAIGESRIDNIEALRRAGITEPIALIRSPMISEAERVVTAADRSLNTELDVIAQLSSAATSCGRRHGVVLMVELGDLREGILPGDLEAVVRRVLRLPGVELKGIGTNLACQSGVIPDERNMGELSALATALESKFGIRMEIVSGGNSASIAWALGGGDVGRINRLRLGESILLGREPTGRQPIEGLRTDTVALVAEVIEAKRKPTRPWGTLGETAFGSTEPSIDHGLSGRAILAVGRQDVDPEGIQPPAGVEVVGASSDHLVVDTGRSNLLVGEEIRFGLDYSALLRAMTSPFVHRQFVTDSAHATVESGANPGPPTRSARDLDESTDPTTRR